MWKITVRFTNGEKKEFTSENSYQVNGEVLYWWLPNGKYYSVSTDSVIDVEELDLDPEEEE